MTLETNKISKYGVNCEKEEAINIEGKDFQRAKEFLVKAKLSKAKTFLKDFSSYGMKHHLERSLGENLYLANGELISIMESLGVEWKLEDRNSRNVFFKISLREWKALVGRASNGEWGLRPSLSIPKL